MAGRTTVFWIAFVCAFLGGALIVYAQDPISKPVAAPLPDLPIPPAPLGTLTPEIPAAPQTRVSMQFPQTVVPTAPPGPNVPNAANPGQIPPTLPFPEYRPELQLPDGSSVSLPEGTKQLIRFGPRYGKLNDYVIDPLENNVKRVTYTGGLIVNVIQFSTAAGQPPQEIEFAADNLVIWIKGMKNSPDILGGIRTERDPEPTEPAKPGETAPHANEKTTVEFYMSGNVIMRTRSNNNPQVAPAPNANTNNSTSKPTVLTQTLRTDELYYDVDKNRAVALESDLESQFDPNIDPIHVKSREIWRLGPHEWKAFDTLTYSSKLPNDPTLRIRSKTATITEQNEVRKNIFGIPYKNLRTGEVDYSLERRIVAERNRLEVFGVPIIPWPRYEADLADPAGPILGFGMRQDGVFGSSVSVGWDMYKLLGYRAPDNHRWSLSTDYMSFRGPALGSDYSYINLLGQGPRNFGNITAYYVNDKLKQDLLGGYRGPEPINPSNRGRFQWTHNQDLYEDGTEYARFLGQLAWQSDKNFYEQYYKARFDTDFNPETFGYLYGANGIFSYSALTEVNVNRQWVTETNWLPRIDGGVVGFSLLDTFIYTGRASAGYAQLRPTVQSALPVIPTEQADNTGRINAYQKVSAPINLGPVRLEPYGVLDLSYYSNDLSGNSVGRVVGAGGVKASVPFSHLYEDVDSEWLNLRGLNHKINLSANYYYSQTNVPLSQLPLLDPLNDNAVDLSYRSFRSTANYYALYSPTQINTAAAPAFASDPLYDSQMYALRRVASMNPETLDNMNVLQLSSQQRLQTKRGPEGNDHTVDWMTLDLSMSIFPNATRDNFGNTVSFLEYNYVWNIGDRLSYMSSAWVDPFEFGAHYLNMGMNFTRPDGTSVYLGCRWIDPLGSRALISSFSYQITRKYSLTLSATVDLGFQKTIWSGLTFNRTGTDMTTSVGFNYNALINNFGLQFLIVPNAAMFGPSGQNRPFNTGLR